MNAKKSSLANDDSDFVQKLEIGGSYDLIYNKSRMTALYSPMCNYIPSNEITFKLMRACIGLFSKEDLWFNQGAEIEEEEERNRNLMNINN